MSDVKQEVAVKDATAAKFKGFTTMEEMLNFADHMIKSKLVPSSLKEPEKVVAIVLQGQEIGLGPATSLNTIHNIQGRVTLSVHAILALLKKRGIAYTLTEDMYCIRDDGTVDPVRIKDVVYTDYRTTVTFYEKWNNTVIEHPFSFYWSEAVKQDLHTKDNWRRMPKIMMRTRALALGARLVAPDALLGLYETTEVADFTNTSVDITEDGGYATIVQE